MGDCDEASVTYHTVFWAGTSFGEVPRSLQDFHCAGHVPSIVSGQMHH